MSTKQCKKCKGIFELDNFYKVPANKDGRQHTCKGCYKESRRQRNLARYHEVYSGAGLPTTMWVSRLITNIKSRAKIKNIPFNITKEDIIIPEKCPILGIPLVKSSDYAKEDSPSIDRIIPELGYVKGNVRVISKLANSLKSDSSIEELQNRVNYLQSIISYISEHASQ